MTAARNARAALRTGIAMGIGLHLHSRLRKRLRSVFDKFSGEYSASSDGEPEPRRAPPSSADADFVPVRARIKRPVEQRDDEPVADRDD